MYYRDENRQSPSRLPLITALISTGVAIAVVAFMAGAFFDHLLFTADAEPNPRNISALSVDSDGGEAMPDFSRLEQVSALIGSEYYLMPGESESAETFWRDLEEKAIQGLTAGLDGHSAYLPPQDSIAASNSLNGTYEGIGIWVSSEDGAVRVVAPIPGSPADRAGIRSGDQIVSIDGQSTEGIDDTTAVERLLGPAGEPVEILVFRPSSEDQLMFSIVRERIAYPVVRYRLLEDSNIAVIQITIFGDRTISELDAAIVQTRRDGATGIVLDLRNNGGGWVESAQETIGRFVPEDRGPALFEDFDPAVEGDEKPEPILSGNVSEFELPMVVLMNHGTASASEIVAGALRDYGRASLIGEQTFGKGSVQRVHDFDDGASLRLTFAHWLTPDHETIEGEGLAPDLIVGMADDGADVDEQLQAAVEHLESIRA
jgi:carboxyl-terminal processing protease